MKYPLVVVVLMGGLAAVNGFECTTNFCTNVDCYSGEFPQCPGGCEPPAECRVGGSTCGCCDMCVTILETGAPCPSPFKGGGARPVQCRSPDTCQNGKCA